MHWYYYYINDKGFHYLELGQNQGQFQSYHTGVHGSKESGRLAYISDNHRDVDSVYTSLCAWEGCIVNCILCTPHFLNKNRKFLFVLLMKSWTPTYIANWLPGMGSWTSTFSAHQIPWHPTSTVYAFKVWTDFWSDFSETIHPIFTGFSPLILESKNWEIPHIALCDPKANGTQPEYPH